MEEKNIVEEVAEAVEKIVDNDTQAVSNDAPVEAVEKQKKERKFVLPGEFIGEGRAGHGTFYENDKVFSKVVGLAEKKDDLIFVIPLSGSYSPKRGDGVIGKISGIPFSKWIVDINSPYQAALSLSDGVDEFVDLNKTDLTRFFNYGDLIFAEITVVTKTKLINLSMRNRRCRKLRGGRIIQVTSAKVPRIIGRGGSMVEMIKNMTGTQIVVGQNGIVWVKGENNDVVAEVIKEIEEKSHIQGLTDHIREYLEKAMADRKPPVETVQTETQETTTEVEKNEAN